MTTAELIQALGLVAGGGVGTWLVQLLKLRRERRADDQSHDAALAKVESEDRRSFLEVQGQFRDALQRQVTDLMNRLAAQAIDYAKVSGELSGLRKLYEKLESDHRMARDDHQQCEKRIARFKDELEALKRQVRLNEP